MSRFRIYTEEHGIVHRVVSPVEPLNTVARIDGSLHGGATINLKGPGAVYGFIAQGYVHTLVDDDVGLLFDRVDDGYGFVTRSGLRCVLSPDCVGYAVQHPGYVGFPRHVGPIEPRGRLRYIDGCSDTLLIGPMLKGEPCLNHLHFPRQVEQTFHHHPSLRAGIVVRGAGWCCYAEDGDAGARVEGGVKSGPGISEVPLLPGGVFIIPTGATHRFRTTDSTMDVIAFHPDSDFGPTHEDHPMVNRTLVAGAKIDNTSERHRSAIIFDPTL